MNFGTKTEMTERLKKDKGKYKCAYTRTKTKLLMNLEGRMASKMCPSLGKAGLTKIAL